MEDTSSARNPIRLNSPLASILHNPAQPVLRRRKRRLNWIAGRVCIARKCPAAPVSKTGMIRLRTSIGPCTRLPSNREVFLVPGALGVRPGGARRRAFLRDAALQSIHAFNQHDDGRADHVGQYLVVEVEAVLR